MVLRQAHRFIAPFGRQTVCLSQDGWLGHDEVHRDAVIGFAADLDDRLLDGVEADGPEGGDQVRLHTFEIVHKRLADDDRQNELAALDLCLAVGYFDGVGQVGGGGPVVEALNPVRVCEPVVQVL